GGVVRALQRIEAILESHERSLQTVSQELGFQANDIERISELSDTLGLIDQIQATHVERISELSDRLGLIDQNSAAHADELSRAREAVQELRELVSKLDYRMGVMDADLKTKLAPALSATEEKIDQVRVAYGQQISSVAADIANVRSGLDQVSEKLSRT